MSRSARLAAFLDALETADPETFCSPPGLGGSWLVKTVRFGLEHHVLTVHNSGEVLAFLPYPTSHGRCYECTQYKHDCPHCSCSHCSMDRQMHGGKPITAAQLATLRRKVREFKFAPERQSAVRLDGE